jgi:hypothetical protein
MEPIVVILMLIVLVIAVLGGGTGTAVAPPPASVPAPSRGQDWLQIVAVIFLLGIVGLTLLGLVMPYLNS